MWLEEREELEKLNIINKAIHIATMAHAGQTRKGTDTPYITHPVACAMLAQRYTDDAEIIVACLLHDVLEDVKPEIYDEKQMRADFGDSITGLVKAVSEPKTAGEAHEKPWKERKDAYFERLEQTKDKRAIVVSCADKICNLNDIINDYEKFGEKIWSRFKADKKSQWWFYQKCYEEAKSNVPGDMDRLFHGVMYKFREILGPRITNDEAWRKLQAPKVIMDILEEAQEDAYQELENAGKPFWYLKQASLAFDYDGKHYHLWPDMFGLPDALFGGITDDLIKKLEEAGCSNIVNTPGVLD